MKKSIITGLLACAFVIALILCFQIYLRTEVTVSTVTRGTAIDAVPAIVSIDHASVITLSGEEGGRIVDSNLTLGERVEEGELLIQIDTTGLALEAEALQSRIKHLETRLGLRMQEAIDLERFKEELDNNERLHASGNYPELEIKRRRREFQAFQENQLRRQLDEQQQLENLRNQLKRLELRIKNTSVYAPATGIVNRLFALQGELIHPKGRIAQIHNDKLLVIAKINEEDFAGIKVDMDATVRLLAYGSKLYPAKVSHVLPGADAKAQQYTVFLKIEIPDELLLPGLSGEASIIRRRKQDALLIPRQALFGSSVFVASDRQAELRQVTVGARGLNQVEILDGLEEGERVIVDGAAELRDGDRIRTR
jgi:multidrug efflux pump subunit AcrA (membrane-fusion protein)